MPAFPTFSRRLLLQAGAAGLVLAACGSGDDDDDASGAPEVGGGFTLYRSFSPEQATSRPVRMPLAIAGSDGSFDLDDPPKSISASLRGPNGAKVASQEVPRHDKGIPTGYYPLIATLPQPGEWTIDVVADDTQLSTTIVARTPAELPQVPTVGDPLPTFATPTSSDARGVDPICTRQTPCPFHATTLEAALAARKPIVFLVSTPAHCQTAICGPVLELLVDRREAWSTKGVQLIHAEVYLDDDARQVAPVVDALKLQHEPALFFARSDGIVVANLDYTWDETELDATFRSIVA
jgi:hypothetical protein